MTLELRLLAYSIVVFFVVVFVQASEAILRNGAIPMANNRDDLPAPSKLQLRLKRLTSNYQENLLIFAPLVLIAASANIANDWTALGARLFFYSRIAHAIWYMAGLPLIRPLFWLIGVIGCAMIFLALFGILN
jgi:uncharacterized MAPEG superfamily protein